MTPPLEGQQAMKPAGWRQRPLKERLKLPPQPMPEQDASSRIHNVSEVALGFTPEQAVREAERCLQCMRPRCIEGCPVGIEIPRFIGQVADGDFAAAAATIRERNLLPAICGRVCPQEEQCQVLCSVTKALGTAEKSVAIGRLERFVADWEAARQTPKATVQHSPTGKRVAVVGSGPAGLTVAGDLARLGHAVTIFEALHRPGGVLAYGIPEFRLPKAIVGREVAALAMLGVEIRYDFVVGKTRGLAQLLADGYDAVFVGTGAGLPKFLGIPGENLCGVYSANEYLTRANLMRAFEFPVSDTPLARSPRVAVLGGGNVAMDSARMALRVGCEKVSIVYRRSEQEMPARIEEVHHAKQEGITFELLQAPTRILGNERGWVSGLEVRRMALGEADASGRRRPEPIPGSERMLELDAVIVAIGNDPNPLVSRATPQLRTTHAGTLVVDATTQRTSMKGVFAGGDIVLGAATVILAMGEGRRAAKAIARYLEDGDWTGAPEPLDARRGRETNPLAREEQRLNERSSHALPRRLRCEPHARDEGEEPRGTGISPGRAGSRGFAAVGAGEARGVPERQDLRADDRAGAGAHVPRSVARRPGSGSDQPRLSDRDEQCDRAVQGRLAVSPLREPRHPEVPGLRAGVQELADDAADGWGQGGK
jgi:glutamate synthase (NADPH/NADH) small chain